jgi:hypothetical protein
VEKILRPGSATYSLPERPTPVPSVPTLTPDFVDVYDRMTASDVKYKYENDPAFASLVDELLKQRGGI